MDSSKLTLKFPSEFLKILTDCISKVRIISSLPIDAADYDEDDKGTCEKIIDSETFQPCQEVQGILNIKKMRENCEEICGTLEALRSELEEKGTFVTLMNYVDESCTKYMNYLALIDEYNENKKVLEKLEQDFENVDKDQSEKSQDLDNRLFQALLDFYENENEISNDESYSKKWIEAQVKQSDLKIAKKEGEILESLKVINFESHKESYGGNAIENFYEYKIKELTDETTRMSELYEKKLDEVELQFQIVKNDRRRFDEMVEKDRKLFDFRQKQIDDYLAMKAKKAADEKLRELQEAKSIAIQAWWRGVMVRCYLGSFKKFKKRARKIRQEMRIAKREQQKNKGKKTKK